jgi:glucose dehydrogenase
LAGIAKVNMATGQLQRIYAAPRGGAGAMLATAGDLVFWGDEDRKFRAFDADTGKILWEAILGGAIENSTISYSVNGKQYIAVLTGDGGPRSPANHNAIYAFALP